MTLRLYEIPEGARVTTVIAPGGQEFTTTRAGDVIWVEAAAVGSWQAWQAGRVIESVAGVAEFAASSPPANQR